MGWRVDTQQVRSVADCINKQYSTMVSVREAVGDIRSHCAISGRSKAVVTAALSGLMNTIESQEQSLGSMSTALKDISRLYEECEKRVSGNAEIRKEKKKKEEEKSETGFEGDINDIWKIIAEGGIIGAGISTIGRLATGNGEIKDFLTSGKYLAKAIGGGATAVSKGGTKAAWKEYLFGWQDGLAGLDRSSPGKTFFSSLKKQLGSDLNLKSADKVKVGAKWAGHILTGIINGVENYGEYKSGDISGGRAVSEAIIETGVDIGLGAAATAAVSAGAVALGVTSAPALIIGGVATVGVMGANALCKWATGGKDIGEVVADAVCDVGEKAVSVVKDAGKGLKKAGESVMNSLKSIGSSWSKAFAW